MPYKPTGRPPGRPRKQTKPSDGTKPDLSEKQWAALSLEIRSKHWGLNWPAAQIAKSVGVSRQMIYNWRKDEIYVRGYNWLISEILRARLDRLDKEEKLKREVPRMPNSTARILMHADLTRSWEGAAKSPHLDPWDNPEPFTDPLEFIDYILKNCCILADTFRNYVKRK